MFGRSHRFRGRVAAAPVLCALVLSALLLASPRADASDGPGLLVGYGLIRQERLAYSSEGHMFSVGIHTPGDALEDGLFAAFTFDFVIDYEYTDLTQLAFTFEGAYAWGSDVFGTYLGVCMRSGIDGYPKASWSPMDPGAVLGLIAFLGPVGIGAEFRGWLGWNVYDDLDNQIEPYFDARVFMSVALD